jgi:hypothetical protein
MAFFALAPRASRHIFLGAAGARDTGADNSIVFVVTAANQDFTLPAEFDRSRRCLRP